MFMKGHTLLLLHLCTSKWGCQCQHLHQFKPVVDSFMCITNVSDMQHLYFPSPLHLGMRMSMSTLASMKIFSWFFDLHKKCLWKATPFFSFTFVLWNEDVDVNTCINTNLQLTIHDHNFENFKAVPYLPIVYKTLMKKFKMISKIGLRQNNVSHSTVVRRPITMLPTRIRHKTNAFTLIINYEWIITTFYNSIKETLTSRCTSC